MEITSRLKNKLNRKENMNLSFDEFKNLRQRMQTTKNEVNCNKLNIICIAVTPHLIYGKNHKMRTD